MKSKFVEESLQQSKTDCLKSEKILLQIIDVSDKMLYNEVKAEKSVHTIINATVSHELRNPLYSLVSQIEYMIG